MYTTDTGRFDRQVTGVVGGGAKPGIVYIYSDVWKVPIEQLTWARIFGTMERAKKEYDIDDYSVSQTSLEQVFINFARAQHSERERDLTLVERARIAFKQRRDRKGRASLRCCVRTQTNWNYIVSDAGFARNLENNRV